ncbi:MAG: malto-oligosyltrehalose synthase [Syntrophobacteraceae bacterium]|nr:malto-oligosyltrehalose synthase [Syntrophobacteraceae bacterium]
MIRTPRATYRIQVNPEFGFRALNQILPYLARLGIKDLYLSPILQARKGSTHGYDLVEPRELNPELGSGKEFADLVEGVKKHGFGWIQDIVPNHMAFDPDNSMLMDVLENREDSEYYSYFDIDWNHPHDDLKNRVLAPFLGRFYGESLDEGEIRVSYESDGFKVHYHGLRFPLKVESYSEVLTPNLAALKEDLGEDHPNFTKLLGILYVLKTLPNREARDERYGQIRFIKRVLWELHTTNARVREHVDRNLERLNGRNDGPDRFMALDALLAQQHFRLAFWKVASEEINYRRFFNINDLICLRAEDKDVFPATHALVLKLVREKVFTGLRVDHIDGLCDPSRYLARLREEAREAYLVVEKILAWNESLPDSWPVQGTTGYDFLNQLNGLFCRKEHEGRFDRIYAGQRGTGPAYRDLVAQKKRLFIARHMTGDVDNLAHRIKSVSGRARQGSDITLHGLRSALAEVMSFFPVYRTYIDGKSRREQDRAAVTEAVTRAVERFPALTYELSFLQDLLTLNFGRTLREEDQDRWIQVIMRFQQFTAPLMAKGFEDTVLYVYNRLLSLNEVGGDPGRFGISDHEFHDLMRARAAGRSKSLSATSTHDTKRGEDVRARIHVLSEIPAEWESHIRSWNHWNRRYKRRVGTIEAPDKNDEYFLYQTLVGAYPFGEEAGRDFLDRVEAYLIKAVREAKVHTAWIKPDTAYEEAYLGFVRALLTPSARNPFLEDFLIFQRRIAFFGIFNSLAQVLIKIAAPGVPDFYQGTELWDLSLVDPDNRRPVDFAARDSHLANLEKRWPEDPLALVSDLLVNREDGRIKLFVIWRGLQDRMKRPDLYRKGGYVPLAVEGSRKDHLLSFARKYRNEWAIVVVPRFLTGVIETGEDPLGERVWQDTRIVLPEDAPGRWRNLFTLQSLYGKKSLPVGKVLEHFPAALLGREPRQTRSTISTRTKE